MHTIRRTQGHYLKWEDEGRIDNKYEDIAAVSPQLLLSYCMAKLDLNMIVLGTSPRPSLDKEFVYKLGQF